MIEAGNVLPTDVPIAGLRCRRAGWTRPQGGCNASTTAGSSKGERGGLFLLLCATQYLWFCPDGGGVLSPQGVGLIF